jgi:serine/threonine-protein kinase
MSPEQIRGSEVDARADVWALAVVLYELLTGTRPFGGTDDLAVVSNILDGTPQPFPADRHLPPALERIVFPLRKQAADRRKRKQLSGSPGCASNLTAPAVGVLRPA